MTNQIAPIDTSEQGLDFLQKQAQAMEDAYRMGELLSKTQIVPKTYQGKPADAAAAILYGAELGLKPQQALQQVFVVHGQPAIYARTMAALLKSKGYTFTTVESTDERVTVTGRSPRGEEETSTWTIERAQRAGYAPKKDDKGGFIKGSNGKILGNMKYITDPQAMNYAKALSEVCRKLAPDVLLGIRYTAEDLELEPVHMEAQRTDRPSSRETLDKALGAQPAPEQPREIEAKTDAGDVAQAWIDRIAGVTSRAELNEIMTTAGQELDDETYNEIRIAGNKRWEEITTN